MRFILEPGCDRSPSTVLHAAQVFPGLRVGPWQQADHLRRRRFQRSLGGAKAVYDGSESNRTDAGDRREADPGRSLVGGAGRTIGLDQGQAAPPAGIPLAAQRACRAHADHAARSGR